MSGGEVRARVEVFWPWWARFWVALKILCGARVSVAILVATDHDPGEVVSVESAIELSLWKRPSTESPTG